MSHDYTPEDYAFLHRVTAAVNAAGLDEHPMWFALYACADAWGPRSAPALGCLLALVRKAWGRSGASTINIGTGWRMGDGKGWLGPVADSEIDALIAALEAAP